MIRPWHPSCPFEAPRVHRANGAGLLAALLLAGCSATLSEAPIDSHNPSPSATSRDPQTIPANFTTPLLDVRTDGREIVWSRGADDTDPTAAPDLWGLRVGAPEPREIYHNPNRDSILTLVAVHSSYHAMVETNIRMYGQNGYRLWLIGEGASVLIDKSDWRPGDRTIPVPFIALSDHQLIWAAVHHTDAGLRFEILAYDLSSRETTVIESADAAETSFWFPSLDQDGKRLVYASIEKVDGRDEFHVYLLDQSQRGSQPLRLDHDGLATMPVIEGDTVVWKAVRANIFNASTLVRYSLSRPTEGPTPLLALGQGLNYPSIGARYLASWQDADSDVGLLDLETGERVSVDPVAPSAQEGRERATVAGDLLVYLRADLSESAPKPLQLTWKDLTAR
jgi:hypothetical protein